MNIDELCNIMEIDTRPIAIYDAPDPTLFKPLVDNKRCIFDCYQAWQDGETLLITKDTGGCPGCSYWMTGESRFPNREAFASFLTDTEGLMCSHEITNAWLDANPPYSPTHGHVLIGALKDDMSEYLKSVTFFVTPDQLSVLMLGASYHAHPNDAPPVIAPFGSGCGQMLTMLPDFNIPQAVIGATDIAMRGIIPANRLAFSVTVPMLNRLLSLDVEKSFLGKPFLQKLRNARK